MNPANSNLPRTTPDNPCSRHWRLVAPLLLTGTIIACSSVQTTKPGVVGVDRKQTMSSLVSEKQLETGSAQAYQEIVGKAKAEGKLNDDPKQTARVRTIADRLIASAGVFRADATQWNWTVNVIDSPEVNAWAMPGGKIAVYTGIIEKLALTDAELAAIMGHEIAHVLREHGRERASRAAAQDLAVGLLGAVAGATTQQLASLATQVTLTLPNSRVQETEADRIGIELSARAGYDPRAAVTLWQKMAKVSGGSGGPQFLSTHPNPENRIADLQVLAAKVMPLYEQARR